MLQAIHTKYVSKLSAIHADQNNQIDIKSYDYHVTKMAAEERAFKKTVRLIIPGQPLYSVLGVSHIHPGEWKGY